MAADLFERALGGKSEAISEFVAMYVNGICVYGVSIWELSAFNIWLVTKRALDCCPTWQQAVAFIWKCARREYWREEKLKKRFAPKDTEKLLDVESRNDECAAREKEIAIQEKLELLASVVAALPDSKYKQAILWVISEFERIQDICLPSALMNAILSAREKGLEKPKHQTLHNARKKLKVMIELNGFDEILPK